VVLALLAGCKGCADDEPPPQVRAAAVDAIETKRLSVEQRRAARKIDPGKKLTVDAAGVTQCGHDIDCFVLTAERCAPSVVDYSQSISIFGVVRHVSAGYTIVGESEERCELHRRLETLDVTLHPELVAALRTMGKTDAELATLQAEALAQAQEQNPKHQVCRFPGEEWVEAVLDLADDKATSRVWQQRCSAVKEEPPESAPPVPGTAPDPGTAPSPAK
jgi:hypothetical protein